MHIRVLVELVNTCAGVATGTLSKFIRSLVLHFPFILKLTCREIRLMSLRAVKIVIGDSMRDSIVTSQTFRLLISCNRDGHCVWRHLHCSFRKIFTKFTNSDSKSPRKIAILEEKETFFLGFTNI